jgi:hypothetical protein
MVGPRPQRHIAMQAKCMSESCDFHSGWGQGQRTLSRFAEENFEEEVVVPSAASSLHSDALLAGVLLEQ